MAEAQFLAQEIMREFAQDTGLSNAAREPRRYLWTDAFAVCNFLELHRRSGDPDYLHLALALIDQVHRILGRYREGGMRRGWLSGFDEERALAHPTAAGLRIGKRLEERQPGEAEDASLEWDRDGQYFHYLSKWMQALSCASRESGDGIYLEWSVELARTAHAAFSYVHATGGVKRMYWKMSTDLSRPLVASMGAHDPLDGLITYMQLAATSKRFGRSQAAPVLEAEIDDMRAMCTDRSWVTSDSLGIGGLLSDACRLVQLIDVHRLAEEARLSGLLHDIERSLHAWSAQSQLDLPAEHRLAFRELGLAIGLQAIPRMQAGIETRHGHFAHARRLLGQLEGLSAFHRLYRHIEAFWRKPANQAVRTWQDHLDINRVMLATCLEPDGCLKI